MQYIGTWALQSIKRDSLFIVFQLKTA